MNDPTGRDVAGPRLRRGIVLRVHEDTCEIVGDGRRRSARFARMFPSPRTERVSPGHLVATGPTADGSENVIWRWYDAVVLGEEGPLIRLWEPAHGEVLARPWAAYRPSPPGARAYASAGLPGADWWVAGPAVARAEDAHVELDEVEDLFTRHGWWDDLV